MATFDSLRRTFSKGVSTASVKSENAILPTGSRFCNQCGASAT